MEVVWFKRDLRVADHRPLASAAARGAVLCLYVYEPSVWSAPDASVGQLAFVEGCLAELEVALAVRGARLLRRVGEVVPALEELHRLTSFSAVVSHEETGNRVTYARDLAVARWCAARGVRFEEHPQNGVVRRLRSRDGWAARWAARMAEPVVAAPARLEEGRSLAGALVDAGPPCCPTGTIGVGGELPSELQPPGEAAGRAALDRFLDEGAARYLVGIGRPDADVGTSSRLSPHLAWGTVSLRTVAQRTERARRSALARGELRAANGLAAFGSRLRWHCHFMQKLEFEPRLEHECASPALERVWGTPEDDVRLDAWRRGATGFPLVDACMRSLGATGWVSFRMRAMLVSFACHQLRLPWRGPALELARRFVDYEPGIHYPQVQMQAGASGINTVRIYSPKKQLLDQDPTGAFVRRWVPELERVSDAWLAEPWRMSDAEQRRARCRVGRDYPAPVVDSARALAEFRRLLFAARRTSEARAEAAALARRHGSRRGGARRPASRTPR